MFSLDFNEQADKRAKQFTAAVTIAAAPDSNVPATPSSLLLLMRCRLSCRLATK